jgi:Phage gp6-like head-tail connector protein
VIDGAGAGGRDVVLGWPTLEELKAELGVTSSSSDAVLAKALDAAIEQVGIDCGGAIVEPSSSQSMAALVLAVMVAKAPAAPYGVAAVFDLGALRVSKNHPTYLRLLVGQRKTWPIA